MDDSELKRKIAWFFIILIIVFVGIWIFLIFQYYLTPITEMRDMYWWTMILIYPYLFLLSIFLYYLVRKIDPKDYKDF